jgi:tRNA nucleotidyltransferase/poly(A) polymerase
MKLSVAVTSLSNAFKAAGFKLFIVGGAVRDFILGLDPKDVDLTTDANPNDVIKIKKFRR